jgi:hypothetical protein
MNSTKPRGTGTIEDRRMWNQSISGIEGRDATTRQRSRPAGATRILPLLLLLILPAVAQAQFEYTVENGAVTITKYTGPGGDVVIPGTIEGLPVTSIGNWAFSDCTGLTSVTIPDSVIIIGREGFSGCTGLTSVTIPNSVTDIGIGVFSGCTGLATITIPNSVRSIGYAAFSGCLGLTSVTIPDSVTSIGMYAFSDCTGLTTISIPNSVTSIWGWAFSGCTSLTSVAIPGSVTSIVDGAFSGCTGLTAIEVEAVNPTYSSLEGVLFDKGQSTLILYPRSKAGDFTIPESVTSIEHSTFESCSSLTSITIPDSVTSIGGGAFGGCTSLTGITIPDTVTTIGDGAFSGCTGLTNVTIGNAVRSIEAFTFYSCTSLTSVTIGGGVTNIWWEAFRDCTSLISITIPDNVTSIQEYAFYDCTGLTGAYFEGNSPWSAGNTFESCPAVIVYYRAGTTGWGATFDGRPTALWIDPPNYSDWLPSTGLLSQYPDASAETDDPDQDGMSNHTEMLAGTDPTDRASLLTLEGIPRPADLSEADRTPLAADQHAIHFRTVPGKQYGIQWNDFLNRAPDADPWSVEVVWRTEAVVTATTTQTRFVFNKPATQAFYRVILAQ